jgi:ATP-dependent Clp protease, protease subunit
MNFIPHRPHHSTYGTSDMMRMSRGDLASNIIIPSVDETEGRIERRYDVFSRLLKDRIIFIGSEIDSYNQVSNVVVAQMLFLQMQDPAKDIHMYINSPGGSVSAGLGIYDTMQFLTCDINTYVIGMAASMGAVLLCAGAKSKRFALPNADIMIHQVSGGAQGTAADVERSVNHMYQLNQRLSKIIARHCGKTAEDIKRDADRDHWMTAEEACAYGIVDKVLENKRDLPAGVPNPSSSSAAPTGPAPEAPSPQSQSTH